MPVRFTVAAEEIAYLIPAPFVNINKTFDKQGDGEILGSRYSIQLKGYIVADRGSPKGDGTFIADGVDVIEAGLDADDWYKAIQKKQKALSNLISKVKAGAYLEIQPPNVGEDAGFSAHVRLESVDLPTHNPGDPFKAEYTINLSADYIIGPTGDVNDDEDDWNRQNKWLISAASENWSIQESDKFVLERESDNVKLSNSRKAFELTRTISATGKNKFKDSTAYADGLEIESGGNPIPNGFSQIYAKNGKAWQQARGYIYDIVRYGNQFLFGKNDTEYTDHLPTTSLPLESSDGDPDDYHLFAMNLPVPDNGASSDQQYKAFNYKRSQTVDAKGGSFSVTETWMLMPSSALVTETMEFTTQEDPATGKVSVTINGSIEGLSDNADTVGVGNVNNKDKDPERKEPVDEVFNYDGEAAESSSLLKSKYTNAVDHYAQVITGLHSTAKHVINDLSGYKQLSVSPIPTSKTVTQQPGNGIITYSVSYETTAGGSSGNFIPYVRTEEFSVSDTYPGQVYAEHVVLGRKLGPVIQSIGTQTHWLREVSLSCNVDVNRKNLCVDSDDEIIPHDTQALCLAASNTDEASGTCSVDPATNNTRTKCEEHVVAAGPPIEHAIWTPTKLTWIFNPNYINFGTSNSLEVTEGSLRQGVLYTTDIITSKPGSAPTFSGTGAPDNSDGYTADDFNSPNPTISKNDAKRHQYVAIKKLLNSLDPLTYLHEDFGGSLANGQHVTRRFTNAPSESWNPKTGAWSYSISWVYEVDHPYTTAASSFFDGDFDDGRYLPGNQRSAVTNEDGQVTTPAANELPRTAPGQNF
tara:strand:+ start:252 stop:2681 length:2430 start_codon:yes stop_codon:yes gene_type:complete